MHLTKLTRSLAILSASLALPATALANPISADHASRHHTHASAKRFNARNVSNPFRGTGSGAFAANLDQGATYYVSPTGSDSNPGTSTATPWKTVTQADRAHLQPGDKVLFQGGATFSDDALMPGWGTSASGTSSAPISFGSYGQGNAILTQGVWFKSDSNLVFQNLTLGSSSGMGGPGFQGNGENVTIEHNTIEHATIAIQSMGSHWTIANNTITDTGDSGMLLGYNASKPGDQPGGSNYLVTANTITDTGMNANLTEGTHGIYLKVADATVTNNTITHFHDDGISIRYRNNLVSGNHISGGAIGLAWFQYDTHPGASKWDSNTISAVTDAGIFVAGTREGSRKPKENFTIAGNSIQTNATKMNLQPTSGTYTIGTND
jgi:parallel beta-helix repeat protein